MTLKDYLASLVRTLVPLAVGWVLAKVGVNAFDVDGVTLQTALTSLAAAGYYAAVRASEARWPKVGVLLGWAVTPTYEAPAKSGGDVE